MRDASGFIIILCIGFAISVVIAFFNGSRATQARTDAAKLRTELSGARRELSDAKETHQQEAARAKDLFDQTNSKNEFLITGLTRIIEQRKSQFPWLATAFADIGTLIVERDARFLESKKHPAKKSAEILREHGAFRREAEKGFRIARYRVEYYEKLFPWIADYVGDDVPDYAVDVSGAEIQTDDPASNWLTKAEYEAALG